MITVCYPDCRHK